MHLATFDGRLGQRAGLEEARGPQPLVDPDGVHARELKLRAVIALVVTMLAKEGSADALLSAVREQAAASLREEPGCTRFDVCVDRD
ncbi:MAG: putative quinol monooxygenase, partial [Gammaproteobacteria bacterium]